MCVAPNSLILCNALEVKSPILPHPLVFASPLVTGDLELAPKSRVNT